MIFVWVLLLLSSCNPVATPEKVPESPRVAYALNYPLYSFALRIAGEEMDIQPLFGNPSRKEIASLQQADYILLSGTGESKWINWVTLPEEKLVDCSSSFRDRYIRMGEAKKHQHGPQGNHSHDEVASLTWLDPTLAVEQARAIQKVLSPTSDAAFQALKEQLMLIDSQLESRFSSLNGAPILFSHPVYQYLERRYNLNGKSMHWEPNEMPSEGEWRALAQLNREFNAFIMIWEAPPLPETETRLQAMGIRSLVFETMEIPPREGNFLTIMRANIERLTF